MGPPLGGSFYLDSFSKEPDREMKVAPIFPVVVRGGALVQIDAVVESDRTNGRRDANARPSGVPQDEGIEVLGLDPNVACIEEQAPLPHSPQGDAQLEARIQENIAPADGNLGDVDLAAEDLLGDVLGHERVLQEASQRIDPAEEKE